MQMIPIFWNRYKLFAFAFKILNFTNPNDEFAKFFSNFAHAWISVGLFFSYRGKSVSVVSHNVQH